MSETILLTPEQVLEHCERMREAWNRAGRAPPLIKVALTLDRSEVVFTWFGGRVTRRSLEEVRRQIRVETFQLDLCN